MTPVFRFRKQAIKCACSMSLALVLLTTVAPPSWAAAPAHDMFSAAKKLSDFGVVRGTNTDATKEQKEPDHAGVLGNKSVWYRWTAPHSGSTVFETLSRHTTFDTVLAIYTGDQVQDLTPVAGNDDASRFTRRSRATFVATGGETYMVALDGLAGKNGPYRLHWAMQPVNDDFATAGRIAGRLGTTTTDNTLATRQDLEQRRGSHSIWYVWTAPATRQMQFDTAGSRFDTVLSVYRGARLSQLRLIAGNDQARGLGNQSRLSFRAQGGHTYRIAVTSFYRGSTGRAVLNWQRP